MALVLDSEVRSICHISYFGNYNNFIVDNHPQFHAHAMYTMQMEPPDRHSLNECDIAVVTYFSIYIIFVFLDVLNIFMNILDKLMKANTIKTTLGYLEIPRMVNKNLF